MHTFGLKVHWSRSEKEEDFKLGATSNREAAEPGTIGKLRRRKADRRGWRDRGHP